MILMIDNYDSFTYNLVQYLRELGCEVATVRNDKTDVAEIASMAPERIVISPGPCTPDKAGVSLEVVAELGTRVPILGVCLGHQVIGQAFGGEVVHSEEHHARQDFDDSPSGGRYLRRIRESVPGDALSLAGGRS